MSVMPVISDDFENRKKLHEEIKKCSRTEQEELYRILKRENEQLSENKNGIFFDLMSLSAKSIKKINEWIQFCQENRVSFEIREKQMNEYRNGSQE